MENSTTVVCDSLPPPDDPSASSFTVNLIANVLYLPDATTHAFRIDLTDPGVWGVLSGDTRPGAITWTDGSGIYPWLELSTPVARGSEWK